MTVAIPNYSYIIDGKKRLTPEATSWREMFRRLRSHGGKHYSQLDISICMGYKEGFAWFFADLGKKPTPQHTLDRTDNFKGYWCGHCLECRAEEREHNVRWASKKEQARNYRHNHLITINGVTKCAVEWEEFAGLPNLRVIDRLRKGWPIDENLIKPLCPPRRFVTHAGITLNLTEWSRRLNLDYKALHQRVSRGECPLKKQLHSKLRTKHLKESSKCQQVMH